MDMTKIDFATATPLVLDPPAPAKGGSAALALGMIVAVAGAPVLLLWVIGDTLVRDLRRLGRGLRAIGEEVVRAARD